MEGNDNEGSAPLRFNFTDLLEQQRALEYQLNNISSLRSEVVKTMPNCVKRRISALKNLQLDYLNTEANFYESIHRVAIDFQDRVQAIHEKRKEIITGQHLPKDEEIFESDKEELVGSAPSQLDQEDNGIPDFWLTVLKCGRLTGDLVHTHDEPILKKLINIKLIMLDKEPLGFTLEFSFLPNEYFSNQVLSKTYYLKFEVDKDDPFSYEGPEIYKSKGCTINWLPGKNITIKIVKKRQKHKNTPLTRTVNKSVKVPSFFNFFSPPKMPALEELIDEKQGEEMDYDFEIGHYMKERLIPRAVLYFTGDGIEEESSFEGSEEETESDDEEEEESYVRRGRKVNKTTSDQP